MQVLEVASWVVLVVAFLSVGLIRMQWRMNRGLDARTSLSRSGQVEWRATVSKTYRGRPRVSQFLLAGIATFVAGFGLRSIAELMGSRTGEIVGSTIQLVGAVSLLIWVLMFGHLLKDVDNANPSTGP